MRDLWRRYHDTRVIAPSKRDERIPWLPHWSAVVPVVGTEVVHIGRPVPRQDPLSTLCGYNLGIINRHTPHRSLPIDRYHLATLESWLRTVSGIDDSGKVLPSRSLVTCPWCREEAEFLADELPDNDERTTLVNAKATVCHWIWPYRAPVTGVLGDALTYCGTWFSSTGSVGSVNMTTDVATLTCFSCRELAHRLVGLQRPELRVRV